MAAKGVDALNTFLNGARIERGATLVVGNESADLDSMVSAIVLSFARSTAKNGSKYVPFINTPRNELRLRLEADHLFKEVKLDTSALCFVDDVNPVDVSAENDNSIVLVDHNRLKDDQEAWSDLVTEVIDHHENENAYPKAKYYTEKVGSCSTLIAESLLDDPSTKEVLLGNECACKLLLSAVLVDTGNHSKEMNKSTPRDRKISEELQPRSGVTDENNFHDTLRSIKFDQGGLSIDDLLRRDYKQWNLDKCALGISSVGLSLKDLDGRENEDLFKCIESYNKEQSRDLFVVMSSYHDDEKFNREILVYSPKSELLEKAAETLSSDDAGCQLKPLQLSSSAGSYRSYTQQNTDMSRKQIQPLLASGFGG